MGSQYFSEEISMHILLTGATGFVGRSTVAYLLGLGHEITAYVRNLEQSRNQLGKDVELLSHLDPDSKLQGVLETTDCVINLAGEQLAGVRWTATKKKRFISSRVDLTKRISNQIIKCKTPPKIFLSASAVGFYNDSYTIPCDEETPKGTGFLRDLCDQWEQAALQSTANGTRVVLMRIGIILGREGGFLKQVGLPFEYGIGNYIARGNQVIPWIHISDVLGIIRFCIENQEVSGPINLVSPNPSTWKTFSKSLAKLLKVKIVIPVPKFLLTLVYGEGADVLASSQYVLPKALERFGYNFIYDSLEPALEEEFTAEYTTVTRFVDSSDDLWNARESNHKSDLPKPTYRLVSKSQVQSSQNHVFNFFSSPLNLGLTTPSWMNFKIQEGEDVVRKGSQFVYKINIGPIPLQWKSKIIHWDPNHEFVDLQIKGPYKLWWHRHKLTKQDGDTILMEDTVLYKIPMGYLGRIAHKLVIRKILLRIFNYRKKVIEQRFTKAI